MKLESIGNPTALVLNRAGFPGSHPRDRLPSEGWSVRCLDDFGTGTRANLAKAEGSSAFELVGVLNVSEAVRRSGARLLHTPTSEIHGDPEIHPQPEACRRSGRAEQHAQESRVRFGQSSAV